MTAASAPDKGPTTPELYIDPELVALLEALPLADFDDDVVRATREMTAELFASYPLADDIERTDHLIEAGLGVSVRIHRPTSDEALPALVWIHGGGFVIGSHLMDGPALDVLARDLRISVVSVDYRLAPETRYPGALDDCHAALRWVHDNADELRIDPRRIGIGGQSAGGGLAAALALRCKRTGDPTPRFQLLDAPMLDDQLTSRSIQDDGLHIWSTASNRYAWRSYLGNADAGSVPAEAAPARATDLADLPPTLVIVGGADGLRDEAIAYAQQLNAAGVPTDLHVIAGATHGVTMFTGTAIVDRWNHIVHDWLEGQVLRPGPSSST